MRAREHGKWAIWGFVIGCVFGLLYVVPAVLVDRGLHVEGFRDSWMTLPGFIAAFFTIAGVFLAESRYVYLAMGLGVVASGLFWAAVAHVIGSRLRRRVA